MQKELKKVEAELKTILCDQLRRGRYQPRREFSESGLQELAESIKSQGLIQPIVVRLIGPDCYEIIAGERRWRASQLAGFQAIRCLVEQCSEEAAALKATIENINREDLNPIEEAQAYQRLVDEFHYTQEKISEQVGKPRSKISNMLRLLRLDVRIQSYLIEKKMDEGHAKVLAGVESYRQYELAKQCVNLGWSVRRLEEEIKGVNEKMSEQSSFTKNVDIERLERAVCETLGSPVSIKQYAESKSGKIEIQFHDLEILQGLLEKMGVEYQD